MNTLFKPQNHEAIPRLCNKNKLPFFIDISYILTYMIHISETAAKRISALKSEDNVRPEAFLRIKVKRGGCSGYSYKLDFDSQTTDKDKVFENHGAKVVVDQDSLLYLLGMTLDYEGGLNGKGFIFQNPNATKNCGCGSSFGV
jgi:iron-sulfur cluster assembly protein